MRVFPAYAFHARGVLFASLVAGALALGLATAAAAAGPRVLVAELDNDINPVTQQYLQDQVRRGERDGYAAVVIELDTPGGLGSSMRKIVKTLLAAKVPVIVYVAPAGSSADSAGAVIGQAADVLAMAPQTNIGSSMGVNWLAVPLGGVGFQEITVIFLVVPAWRGYLDCVDHDFRIVRSRRRPNMLRRVR